jgi:hypothetical protein
VFSDGFSGPAGSPVSPANWKYDTGPGPSFGTGEIETMTNSTNNVYLDGNGHLVIKAINSGGSWTSGRIQTPMANVGAPAGGELEVTASIEQPNPAPAVLRPWARRSKDPPAPKRRGCPIRTPRS